jgi:hypothetical protein
MLANAAREYQPQPEMRSEVPAPSRLPADAKVRLQQFHLTAIPNTISLTPTSFSHPRSRQDDTPTRFGRRHNRLR